MDWLDYFKSLKVTVQSLAYADDLVQIYHLFHIKAIDIEPLKWQFLKT